MSTSLPSSRNCSTYRKVFCGVWPGWSVSSRALRGYGLQSQRSTMKSRPRRSGWIWLIGYYWREVIRRHLLVLYSCSNEIVYQAKVCFLGIALLISALVQSQTLSLYHMHIIYDTISLVVSVYLPLSLPYYPTNKNPVYPTAQQACVSPAEPPSRSSYASP